MKCEMEMERNDGMPVTKRVKDECREICGIDWSWLVDTPYLSAPWLQSIDLSLNYPSNVQHSPGHSSHLPSSPIIAQLSFPHKSLF